jgi:hypothetical protein
MATTQTKVQQVKWADNALTTTTAQASQPLIPWGDNITVQAVVSGTGAVTATVPIQVSNTGTEWITVASLALSGTTTATDGLALSARWGYVRAGTLSNITGTGATITLYVGGAGA